MSRRYDLVIFDLDGTLHDSFRSIALSYQYALREGFGNDQPDLDTFRPCVGPPIQDSFALFGVTPSEVGRAIELYEKHFLESAQYECGPFDGVKRMLEDFKAAGIDMAIASSKHTAMLEYLMERDGLRGYFGMISGIQNRLEETPKKLLIERVLAHYGEPNKSRVVMVGDRHYDAEGAFFAGVDFIAAAYGMGEEKEFDGYPAVFHAQNIEQLRAYILGEE